VNVISLDQDQGRNRFNLIQALMSLVFLITLTLVNLFEFYVNVIAKICNVLYICK